MPTSVRSTLALPIFALALLAPALGAQDDVEAIGRIYGTRPPAAYYDLRRTDPGSFEFGRAWKARNPNLVEAAPGPDGRPRFEARGPVRADQVTAGALLRSGPNGVVQGTFRFPLVLGYFADDAQPPAYTVADVQREFFDGPSSRAGTIPEFYAEISGGRVALEGETFGWVQSGLTRLETTAGVSALGGRVGLFIHQLLEAADDGSVDWGRYDNDGPDGLPNSGDDDGFVDILAVFHPTFGAECGGAGQDDRVWAHKWTLSNAWLSIPPDERPAQPTFETSSSSASGGRIRIDDYTIQPVISCDGQSINEIGVLAHELGHGFGLPDLYCTSTGCVSNGIGRWGLMGTGSWGCGSFDPSRPCHMSAWSKAVLGWVEVETLGPDTDHGVQVLDAVESAGRVVRIEAQDGSDEYFLLENRQRIGFDADLPGTGLLVWHVDPDEVLRRWPSNTVNAGRDHLGVWLRQADGRLDLEGGQNRSDAGDPFPGLAQTHEFHAGVAPRSWTHDGRPAGVTLVDIEEESPTRQVRFRAVTGFRSLTVDVEGASPSLVQVDDVPVSEGGLTVSKAPFQGVVLQASPGESLGEGIRRPFKGWQDDPGAAVIRVFIVPLEDDATVTALYGGEEIRITPEVQGGLLGVVPGLLATTPASTDLWLPAGESITIRAVPAEGFSFLGWLGEWNGRPNPFSLSLLEPITVGAEFGLTFSSLATPLARDPALLDPSLRTALDEVGNGNGRYDVGDLRAYLMGGGGAFVRAADGAAPAGGVR